MEDTIGKDQLISYHRNLYDYVESPQDSLQIAFGDREYGKFAEELVSGSDTLKVKVLGEVNDAFRLSNNIDLALLSSEILDALLSHLTNPDPTIRELSSRAVSQVAKIFLGKNQLLASNGLHLISQLLNDDLQKIRENGYNCLFNYSDTQEGKDRILETSILPQLIKKLKDEKVTYLLIKNLEILNSLFEGEKAISQTLSTSAIVDLLELLSNDSNVIKELVINNLASISFNELGKSSIIFKNGVIRISPFVTSSSVPVIEAATICLCSLAQLNDAKNQIIDQGKQYFQELIQLLDHKNRQIVTNTVQLIGSIAEHKQGRQWAQVVLPKLKTLKGIDEDYLKQTIDIIEWKP